MCSNKLPDPLLPLAACLFQLEFILHLVPKPRRECERGAPTGHRWPCPLLPRPRPSVCSLLHGLFSSESLSFPWSVSLPNSVSPGPLEIIATSRWGIRPLGIWPILCRHPARPWPCITGDVPTPSPRTSVGIQPAPGPAVWETSLTQDPRPSPLTWHAWDAGRSSQWD